MVDESQEEIGGKPVSSVELVWLFDILLILGDVGGHEGASLNAMDLPAHTLFPTFFSAVDAIKCASVVVVMFDESVSRTGR